MKTYSIKNLTEEQLRLVLESLLVASTAQVNASWYAEDYEKMFNLASDIRKDNSNILLENTFILKDDLADGFSEKLLDYFPEIEVTPF